MSREREIEVLEESKLVKILNEMHEVTDEELEGYALPPVSKVARRLGLFPAGMLQIISGSVKKLDAKLPKQRSTEVGEENAGATPSSFFDDDAHFPRYMNTEGSFEWINEVESDCVVDNINDSDLVSNETTEEISPVLLRASTKWTTNQLDRFLEKNKMTLTSTQYLLKTIDTERQNQIRKRFINQIKKIKFRARAIDHYTIIPMRRLTPSEKPFSLGSDDFNSDHFFEYQKYRHGVSDFYLQAEAASNTDVQYRLPIHLSDLIGCTVLDYLMNYCHVSSDQKLIYNRLLNETQLIDRLDGGALAIREKAKDMLINCITEKHLNELIELLDFPKSLTVDGPPFILAMALTDRLYGQDTQGYSNEYYRRQADVLERLDFRNLEKQLEGVSLDAKLVHLLRTLAATGFDQTQGPEQRVIESDEITSHDSTTLLTLS